MYEVTKYPPGAFSWADCVSRDAEKVKSFYTALFGWTKVELPIGGGASYTMFQLGGRNVAALVGMRPDVKEMGIPSHWNNYVTVDDVDALAGVVRDNGGSILYGPQDVFDSGRTMMIQDPTGATLNLWQPRNHIGAGLVNAVGAMCWNELITNDAERAQAFYNALFGWAFYGDEHYTRIRNKGRDNGGLLQMSDVPPCWMVYFHVADIDAGNQRATELGGSVALPKQATADGGFWSVVVDPAGAYFCLIQLVKADPWLE